MTMWTGPGTTALTAGARRLTDLAADVRRHAALLTAAASSSAGWRSTAATSCRARLGETGRDLVAAAALLDHAATAVDDHARAAASRAAALERAAAEALTAGARGLLDLVLP